MEEKKKPNRKRTKQFSIRVTEEEFKELQEKIEQSGMSQREFAVKALLECKVTNTDGIKELLPQLGKLGNNLNQIARSCNTGNQATKEEVEQIGKELNEVWQLLRQSIQGQA